MLLFGLGMLVVLIIFVMFQIRKDLGTWREAFIIVGGILGLAIIVVTILSIIMGAISLLTY